VKTTLTAALPEAAPCVGLAILPDSAPMPLVQRSGRRATRPAVALLFSTRLGGNDCLNTRARNARGYAAIGSVEAVQRVDACVGSHG